MQPQLNLKLRELENSLHRVYLKIFREIKKEPDYSNNLFAIQRKYNRLVYDNTRAVIQEAVIIGIEQVNRKLKTQPYMTKKDIEVIEKNTDRQVASFWRKIQLEINEERQRLLEEALQSPMLVGGGIRDFLKSTAISSVFTAVADAVVSKVNQLVDVVTDREKLKLRWVTIGDTKVCPICKGLDGREFNYDDPDIPRPNEEDTHYNCRCQLFVI